MKNLTIILVLFTISVTSFSQPSAGDWFREYKWTTPAIDGNEAWLRVGGKFDYRNKTPQFPDGQYNNGEILLPHNIQLKNAFKAEIMIEKNLCHDYTTGLSVYLNGNPPILFPEAKGIPEPQEGYLHHFFPVVEVPLSQLNEGKTNFFSFTVDSFQHWGWPQNLIYGVTLRIYYKVTDKELATIKTPDNNQITANQELILQYSQPEKISQVDYIAKYVGPDMNGDGIFYDWHYAWYNTQITNHIGSTATSPFSCKWDISWLPDQDKPIKIAARVTFKNTGLIYQTETIDNLTITRNYQVKFCKPFNIPQTWTTRNQEYANAFFFDGDKTNIDTIKVVWRSWSPGYMNGLYLNDELFFIREGERYCYDEHAVYINNPKIIEILNPGVNFIKTGKTPEHNWQMVHGMDVMYPGPMVLIKFKQM